MTQDVPSWRERFLQALRARPGASTRDIARSLGVSEWTADYHLRRMLKAGDVTSEPLGRTRCWYASGCGLCPVLRRAVPALRRPEARALALAAEEWPPLPLPRLAQRAALAIGTARWTAGVLEEAFLLERTRFGRLSLRRGAATCVAAAASGERCGLWGKCHVSRAWADKCTLDSRLP